LSEATRHAIPRPAVRSPPQNLPAAFRLAVAGLAATTLLIVGAAAVRTTPADEDDDDPATAVASADPRPVGSNTPAAATAARSDPRTASSGATSAAPAPVPAGARELRARLRDEVLNRRIKDSVATLKQLLDADPRAPEDADVRRDIVELSMRVMLVEGSEPEAVFDLITNRTGTVGADILYELLTTRGGSRAARRAEELLATEAVRAKGTPAMRVAYDMRTAKGCDAKIALFDRAKTEGDSRTLGQLQLMNRSCGRRGGECCLHNDPKLKETIEALKAR
jgi:hypothetical protein